MEPYDSMHRKVWNEKQKFEILKDSNFCSNSVSLSGNNWKTTENGKRYNKTGKSECFQTVRYKDLGFSASANYVCSLKPRPTFSDVISVFFLRSCSSGSFSNFRSYSRGSYCCFRSYCKVFDIFRCHYCGFLRFSYDSIRFHAYNYIILCDSMHGII